MPGLLIERFATTTVFTIDRPDSLNAMNAAVKSDLAAGLVAFNADASQSVAVITGTGDRAFCSGADLKEMAGIDGGEPVLPVSAAPDIAGIGASEKPVIAAINGLAVGAGLEIALLCDLRIAAPTAWFGAFEVKRGFLPGIAVNLLARLVPYGVAADTILAGERLSADRAYQVGLVQALAEPDRLLDAAIEKAEAIAAHSPTAVWGAKKVMSFWRDLQLAEQQRYYEAVVHRVMLTGDALEGPRAFAQKRDPEFARSWPSPLTGATYHGTPD